MTDAETATAPGEIAGRPKLVVRYPTSTDAIAELLPPGLSPAGDAIVQIGVYCVPVNGEPEHGISVKVPARVDGVDGAYTLGYGIDQESAIFVSRETNGQPKYPCTVRYFRLGDEIHATAEHQGTTFFEYHGTAGPAEPLAPTDADGVEHEWWIKVSRAAGTGAASAPAYDLEPRIVVVRTVGRPVSVEPLDGQLTLRSSAWDPIADLLPPTGEPTAALVRARLSSRTISTGPPLDPIAFWPFADTVGGSRWPGRRGAPATTSGAVR